jgi:hypothetical protein
MKTLIMAMFKSMPFSLFKTEDNMATPCLVNAKGGYLVPPRFESTICDLKLSNSCLVSSSMKSSGKRSIFLRNNSKFAYYQIFSKTGLTAWNALKAYGQLVAKKVR